MSLLSTHVLGFFFFFFFNASNVNNKIVLFSFDSILFYITVFAKMVFKKFSVPGNRMLDSKLFQFRCKL